MYDTFYFAREREVEMQAILKYIQDRHIRRHNQLLLFLKPVQYFPCFLYLLWLQGRGGYRQLCIHPVRFQADITD